MRARATPTLVFLVLALAVFGPGQVAFGQVEDPASSMTASGWTAASIYVKPAAATLLASTGLRGGFVLDGSAFTGIGMRLSLEAWSNLAGIADGADWAFGRLYPLAYAASGNDRLEVTLDLKEAWFDFSLGDLDLRIGKQLFAWGLADGSNPTDNANARYVGTRLVSTLDEQKMGSLAANIVWNLPENRGSVQGIFMPVSIPNDMPSIAMDLTIPGSPIMHIVVEDDSSPVLALENVEGGLRALLYAGKLSFSLSWLSFLDRYPDYRIRSAFTTPPPTTTVTLSPFHSRVNQFGLDAAWLWGGFDLRSEWALTLTGDVGGRDPALRNSSVSGVVQLSRSFFDGALSASVAWAPRFVLGHMRPSDYAAPGDQYIANMLASYNGQAYALEQIGSLRIAGKLWNETLQPELLFLASHEARDWLTTVIIGYNIADGVNAKAGCGFYGSFRAEGDPEREWGLFSNSRTINEDYLFLELRVSL